MALAGLQLARALGAEVTVLSRSEEKLQRAKALGASGLINTSLTPEWSLRAAELTGDVDLTIFWSLSAGIICASLRMPLRREAGLLRLVSLKAMR